MLLIAAHTHDEGGSVVARFQSCILVALSDMPERDCHREGGPCFVCF